MNLRYPNRLSAAATFVLSAASTRAGGISGDFYRCLHSIAKSVMVLQDYLSESVQGMIKKHPVRFAEIGAALRLRRARNPVLETATITKFQIFTGLAGIISRILP